MPKSLKNQHLKCFKIKIEYCKNTLFLVQLEGFEPPTFRFVVERSTIKITTFETLNFLRLYFISIDITKSDEFFKNLI